MLLRRSVCVALLALVPVLSAGACSSSGSGSPGGPGADGGDGGPAGPVARFKLAGDTPPDLLDVPFPSDAYLANGKIIEPIPGFDRLVHQNSQFLTHELAKMDGFSRVALAFFYVDDTTKPPDASGNPPAASIDPSTLPSTEDACVADMSSVFLIDLAATDPTSARVRCRAAFHDDTSHLSKDRPVVAVGPGRGIVLAEGHSYAAVLTSRVKDAHGTNLLPSSDFATIAGGTRTGALGALYGGALDKANALLKNALASDGSRIVALAPYTTNSLTRELFQMRGSLDSQPAPTLAWDAMTVAPMGAMKFAQKVGGVLPAGFTASLDDWLGVVSPQNKLPDGTDDPDSRLPVRAHDQISAVGTAVFMANNYLISKPNLYDDLDDATFTHDGSGNVIPAADNPKVKIWVTFFIPSTPMPSAGYPAVIVQHGLGGSRTGEPFDIANVFAHQGWITVAIDSVTFGPRAPETRYQVDQVSRWQNAPGAVYKGPDGFADGLDATGQPSASGQTNGSSDLFGGLKAIGALRDQFRQAEFDTAQLVQVLTSNPDLSPLKTGATVPKIDPSKIAYLGDSLGGIEGAVAAAIEPKVKLWVLNVAGGGLLDEIAAHAPGISALLTEAGGLNFGILNDYFTESHPLTAVIQTIADPGDPINYAPYLVTSPGSIDGAVIPPRSVLQIEVLYDELVSNEGDEALARAGGYGLAVANVLPNAGVDSMNLVKAPDQNPNLTPLAPVMPDSNGLIHDTPFAGVTTVVVQTSPSNHGDNLFASMGHRQFAIPFGQFDTAQPFILLDPTKQFDVHTSYLQLQGMVTRFLTDGFAGGVPNVTGFKPPVRDFDDDGNPDATDPDPSDPTVK